MVDVVPVCGVWRLKAWANRGDAVPVRWYRVPYGTPALPIPHAFFHPDWDPSVSSGRDRSGLKRKSVTVEPGQPGFPVGVVSKRVRYDRGALQAGWRPPTHFIGTPEQWLSGSVFGRDNPLTWRGGFSEECRQLCQPQEGEACALGCDEAPLSCPVWCVQGFQAFAGLDEAVIAKRPGCLYSSECVASEAGPAPGVWEVILPESFGGLSNAYVWWQGSSWSTCCDERSV